MQVLVIILVFSSPVHADCSLTDLDFADTHVAFAVYKSGCSKVDAATCFQFLPSRCFPSLLQDARATSCMELLGCSLWSGLCGNTMSAVKMSAGINPLGSRALSCHGNDAQSMRGIVASGACATQQVGVCIVVFPTFWSCS